MMQKNSIQSQNSQRSILMLPWLAHGHISPFLELAKRLTSRNFTIYFCSTPINLNSLTEKIDISSIQLVDLHLPDSPELPPHYHTTKDLPPHLMPLLVTAFNAAKPYFSELLKALKPGLVIYDCLQPWVPSAATEQSIPSCMFLIFSGVASSFFTHYGILQNTRFPFPVIAFEEDEFQRITGVMEHTVNGITNWERYVNCVKGSAQILLIKSSREIEGKYIDYLSKFNGKRVVTVGPLIQEQQRDDDGSSSSSIINWLNQRDTASVVFVSFGSEYFLSREETEEIAYGLELSSVAFIWVIRFHHEDQIGTISEVLPEGFLNRIKNRGMVVENWAPQVEILKHSSVGGFVSHCGWSSTLEAIASGIPIIAMPVNLDQPLNAKLVVELGVAMDVKKRDKKFRRDEICRVIRDVVVNEGGKEVREKAKELMKKMNKGIAEQTDAAMEVIADVIIKE